MSSQQIGKANAVEALYSSGAHTRKCAAFKPITQASNGVAENLIIARQSTPCQTSKQGSGGALAPPLAKN